MRLLLSLLLVCTTSALAQFGPPPESNVTVKLVADRESIKPGEPFLLGIDMTITNDWHTYWENPGFAGGPTTWSLEEIPGLEIGPLRYPFPKKWVDDAEFITYGYDDKVLFTAEAVYTGDALGLEIKGQVDWLECKQVCIKGSDTVRLVLDVGESKPANTEAFQNSLDNTDVPFSEQSPFTFTADYTFEAEVWNATVTLTPKEATELKTEDLILYPLGNDFSEMKHTEVSVENGNAVYKLRYDAFDQPADDLSLEAVVQWPTPDGFRYFRLPLYGQTDGAGAVAAADTNAAASTGGSGAPQLSIWFALLLGLIGGVILNLMPCVLPVLSMKVFALVNKAGESKGTRLAYGWVYTLGIMVSFLALSLFFVAAQSAGEQLGVGFQFQNPYFVIGVSLLIFVMALSFMGVFHFGTPNVGKLQQLSHAQGLRGAFFQGILMTILSTPCTAPALGTAYAWALSQPPVFIILTFQVIAFGLALPYLMLCYAPALLKFIPKPGPWMETFKVVMGYLLLATVIWLYTVAAELMGKDGVVGMMVVMLGLAAGLSIYGKTALTDNKRKGMAWSAVIVAATVYVGFFSLYDVRNPTKQRLAYEDNLILTYLSQNGGESESLYTRLDAMQTTADKIAWVPYSDGNLSYFREQDRLIFIDFTAAWCLTCKYNEKTIIDTRGIRELFEQENVVTMMADYTDEDPEMTEVLKSFGRAGVPMYLVYPGNGDPILLPEIITDGMLRDAVADAKAQMQARASLN